MPNARAFGTTLSTTFHLKQNTPTPRDIGRIPPNASLRRDEKYWEASLKLNESNDEFESATPDFSETKPSSTKNSEPSRPLRLEKAYEPSVVLQGFEEDDVDGLRAAYQAAKERLRELEV